MGLTNGAKSELEALIHNIVHDLRSPLVTIESMVVLLRDSVASRLDKDETSYLEHIESGARLMRDLLSDLTEFTLLAEKVDSLSAVDLRDVMDQLLVELAPEIARAKGDVRLDGELPTVRGDAAAVQTILRHLLENSLKFVRPGAAPAVSVTSRRRGGFYEIEVADEGIGIPEASRQRVFGIFTKLHPRAKYGGNGIGLALVKRAVESHGGQVRIEPREPAGTRVIFTLPA
ncbi:MAG: hypothetical protein HYY25_09290 [Candidatus Wallbacteria bacterium]|nr:hypothetical protein [Candidatus Wallbacteria bacterium]